MNAVANISMSHPELSFATFFDEVKSCQIVLDMFMKGEAAQLRSLHVEFKLMKSYKKVRK